MRKSVERVKAGELEKRKKVWEEKEERERPSKRTKKVGDEKGTRPCGFDHFAFCPFLLFLWNAPALEIPSTVPIHLY